MPSTLLWQLKSWWDSQRGCDQMRCDSKPASNRQTRLPDWQSFSLSMKENTEEDNFLEVYLWNGIKWNKTPRALLRLSFSRQLPTWSWFGFLFCCLYRWKFIFASLSKRAKSICRAWDSLEGQTWTVPRKWQHHKSPPAISTTTISWPTLVAPRRRLRLKRHKMGTTSISLLIGISSSAQIVHKATIQV